MVMTTNNMTKAPLPSAALEARQLIDSSGMSDVFSVDCNGGRQIVKMARPEVPGAEESLMKEARAYEDIGQHQHIMPYLGSGKHRDQFYIRLGYLDKQHFMTDDEIQPMDEAQVVRVAYAIAGALAYVHQKNYLHLDVKPDNVWLGNVPMLFDFGLAQPARPGMRKTSKVLKLTPSYALPNRMLGNPGTFRDDLYALGVTLFYWSTGYDPFKFATTWDWEKPNAFPDYFGAWLDEHDNIRGVIERSDLSWLFKRLLKSLLLYRGAEIFCTATDVVKYIKRSFPSN